MHNIPVQKTTAGFFSGFVEFNVVIVQALLDVVK